MYTIPYNKSMTDIMSTSLEAFRENVSETLTKKDISLSKMADDLNMSRPGLSRVLNGHNGITLDRAAKIAEYLGVPLTRLLRIREKVA